MQRGYLRNKIGSRIEGIRNRSRQDGSASVASSAPSYSELTRSVGGFLMVDEEAAGLPPEEDQEGEEEGGRHVRLEQSGMTGEDHLSDIEKDLEQLVTDEEDGEGQPRPKPKAAAGPGGSAEEEGGEEEVKRKPWQRCSQEVYEEQLELLQGHLTTAMLDNQNLQEEVVGLRKAKEEASNLRRENAILTRRLSQMSSDDSSMGGGASDAASGGRASSSSSPKLKLAASFEESGKGSSLSSRSFGGSFLTTESSEDGFETVNMSPDARVARQREQQRARRKSRWYLFVEWCYDFIADFTQEQSSLDDVEPETPLAAKKLKNNLQRLSRTSKPWQEFGNFLQGILQWRNTAESLVVFLIYMYCVWHGWILSMLAFLAILMLTLTYLRTSGLAEQFGFHHRARPVENVEELGFGDKLQMMKQVAQTCQNKSELVSDTLEKAQNLFLWHQPEATRRIYSYAWVFFIASILLPNSYLLTAIGLFAGVKFFIIDNIYRKYPKVKEKYDTIARMWKSLPTDAELVARQSLTAEQLETSAASQSPEGGHVTRRRTEEEIAFCSRFQLSSDELPLPSWKTGKRCSTLDRDRPLTLKRSGRLFLTHSHLCFERHTRQQRDPDRFVLSLFDVVQVVKAKPFAVLPGSGMSIEVTLRSGVKHLFSAILGRDQAYQSILDQGMILGLPWGTDIEAESRGRGGGAAKGHGGNNRKSSPALSDSSRSEAEGEGSRDD